MMKILDGRVMAEKIKDRLVQEIIALNSNCPLSNGQSSLVGERPNLAIILAGDSEESALYVKLKQQEAQKVGIDTHLYRFSPDVPEKDILDTLAYLNQDDLIDAVLVQLPLPAGLDADKIIGALNPEKDADCFHPKNITRLNSGGADQILPPVYQAVLALLQETGEPLKGKKIVILAKAKVFGQPFADYFSRGGADSRFFQPDQPEWPRFAKAADIIISAVGHKHFLTGPMIKKGAALIDIGITKEGAKVFGDVDAESVKEQAAFLSPVPGGVGPLTIAMLFANTLRLYRQGRGAKMEY